MKKLRHLAMSAAFAFVVLLPFSAQADEDHLPIVFEDYPPYEYVEEGEVRGINLDLIREAFKRIGIKPFFEPRPWKRALFQLRTGEILALSSGFRTREREEFAVFSDTPLAMETNVIAVRSNSGITIDSLEQIKGRKLGVVREYIYGEPLDSIKEIEKIEARGSEQLLKMLLNGRVDLVVGNKAVFSHLAKKYGRRSEIEFVYEVGSAPLYLMFSRARGEEAAKLAGSVGIALESMKEDGTFQDILDRY